MPPDLMQLSMWWSGVQKTKAAHISGWVVWVFVGRFWVWGNSEVENIRIEIQNSIPRSKQLYNPFTKIKGSFGFLWVVLGWVVFGFLWVVLGFQVCSGLYMTGGFTRGP